MIDTAKLEEILLDCLYRDEELQNPSTPPDGCILAEGITQKFGFHPVRLESHRAEVKAMLDELPDAFKKSSGGGWSFLNACMTKNNEQWGEHRNIEQLLVLAIGLKLAEYALPRDMWMMLPGGMPYFTIAD